MAGPYPYPESFPQHSPYPDQVPSPYPGALPPPVPYPGKPRRRGFLIAGIALLVVVALAAAAVTIVFALRRDDKTDTALTPASARTSIQGFLDALSRGDDEEIARHASCGVFDEIKDKKSDMALANLASDAFRRQFGTARVTSIDKIVTWSPNQAQVLFTMEVTQAGRSQTESSRQAIAQVLVQDPDILVCSYLPRTGHY
jgi:hypothetical protein